MAEALTFDEQLERSMLTGTMSLALKRCRRDDHYKNCGVWWLLLSNIDLLKRENNRVRWSDLLINNSKHSVRAIGYC